ncbi:MAG: hypothetical protein ABIS03_10620 [Gemmatimonadaceae bacterium]
MKQKILLAAIGSAAIGMISGCAQNTAVGGAPEPSQSMATSQSSRWTANIQSVTQNRGDVAASTRDRSYGSATWTTGQSAALSVVDLVFTYSGQERFLAWSILPGNCGTGSLPILATANFPEINIASGGRGQVTASLPVELPANGAYHVAIYRDRRQGIDALVACGNLKYNGR